MSDPSGLYTNPSSKYNQAGNAGAQAYMQAGVGMVAGHATLGGAIDHASIQQHQNVYGVNNVQLLQSLIHSWTADPSGNGQKNLVLAIADKIIGSVLGKGAKMYLRVQLFFVLYFLISPL